MYLCFPCHSHNTGQLKGRTVLLYWELITLIDSSEEKNNVRLLDVAISLSGVGTDTLVVLTAPNRDPNYIAPVCSARSVGLIVELVTVWYLGCDTLLRGRRAS